MSLRIQRCPACRRRLTGEEPLDEPCQRCESSLSWVRLAERQADAAVGYARLALSRDEPWIAVGYARRATQLVDCASTRRTLAASLHAVGAPRAARRVLDGE